MKYTFPVAFDMARAQELGMLVASAYQQFANPAQWKVPAGYTELGRLSVKEIWKLPGIAGEFAEQFLRPVPFGFVAKKGADVHVVFRGTMTPLEWLDDFAARPVPFTAGGKAWGSTTRGFMRLWIELGPQVQAALQKHVQGGGGVQSVFVTGHSLGGAMAHLCAADVCVRFKAAPVSYTFSGPRAGDPGFAAAFESAKLATWRVFNTEDLVPTLPPAAVRLSGALDPGLNSAAVLRVLQLSPVGYQHIGYPVAATFHRETVAGNHELGALCEEIAKA